MSREFVTKIEPTDDGRLIVHYDDAVEEVDVAIERTRPIQVLLTYQQPSPSSPGVEIAVGGDVGNIEQRLLAARDALKKWGIIN